MSPGSWAVPVLVVVGFLAVGLYSLLPPRAVPADAADTEFSAARAFEHVEVVGAAPHPIGSNAIGVVRNYLVRELRALGLEPEPQAISVPDYYGGQGSVDVVNLVATIPGTSGTEAVALVAHYDTMPAAPGANDNSTAVAALLETGRALLAGPPLRNDVILLFTDGEEPGPRYGATAFVAENPAAPKIAVVVNLEAIGGSGPSMLVETSGSETWMVEQLAAAVHSPTAFSFAVETAALIGDVGTDFDPFRNAGISGLHFAYMRGSPIYHSPADDVDSVSRASLQHHGANALGLARHFGDLDLTTAPAVGDSVYFTFRPLFIQFSTGWSIAAVFVAVVLLGVAVVRSRHDPHVSAGSLARSAGVAFVVSLVAALAATLLWVAVASLRSHPSVLESYWYLLCLVGGGAGLGIWLGSRWSPTTEADRFGFVFIWTALGLLTAFAAAGFSYLFTLPALAAAIVLNWRPGGASAAAGIRFALVAAPTVILLTPAVDFFFQMAQPRPGNPDSNIPATIAVALLLVFLAGGLLISVWRTPRSTADSSIESPAAPP